MPLHAATDHGRVEIRAVEYRVLGPIAVYVDGRPLKLGGPRQRTVLALLLARANRAVSQDTLIEHAWAGEPPDAAKVTLQGYIHSLRKELGAEVIIRDGDGYRIDVDDDALDALRFERLVELGRHLVPDQPGQAESTLREALALWYGNPYSGLEGNPYLFAEATRLEELRLLGVESRIDTALTLGDHAGVVSELEILVRDHPFHERFRAQQMLALYRCGRQAEALRSFQSARAVLGEELGIEPSSQLRGLEQLILEQDPSLDLPPGPLRERDSDGGGRRVRGYELREELGRGDFGVVYRAFQPSVGREVAVKVIRSDYANGPDFVRRFEREAQIVAQLEHPHIVPLFDFWRDPDGAYLVLPYMRGGSLGAALRHGGWNLAPAIRLLEQVGAALSHAHRRGVVHRDVKPENVLLDEEGNAYLSDFGIAIREVDGSERPVTTSPAYVPPEELRGEPHTVRSDVFSLGVLAHHLLTGFRPVHPGPLPALESVRPGMPGEVEAALRRATDDNPANRPERVEDLIRALRRAVGADVVGVAESPSQMIREPARNPYKGLRSFLETDAVDFYGREGLVDELLKAMADHNLVTLVGPSGSGKSSAVRAGLVPALRAGALPGSRHWMVTDMYPGTHPFEELEAALLRVSVERPGGLLSELQDRRGLLRAAKWILPGDDSVLVLLIDQFEELFSTVRSESTRRLFLDHLVEVAGDARSRIRIVLTLRADFFDRPLQYSEFAAVLSRGLVTVAPPNRDSLSRAISAPARGVGVELEPGLAGRIVADVEGQPGGLPLLQYALTELFARREGDVLTIAGYEETGGVLGALARRAEELYLGLPEPGRDAVRQLFLRLVTVHEAAADTRRRARQAELRSLEVDREALEVAVTQYGAHRLLSFDRDPVTRGPTVEVAHEALLREWDRLREWIDEERENLVLARRLSEAADDWVSSGRDPSFLLRGTRLDQVEEWKKDGRIAPGVALMSEETDYIAASIESRETELAVSRRRRRRTVVSLAVGLALVSLLAAAALVQRGVAEQEALRARVRELAVASGSHLEGNPELALLVAVEAFDESIRAGGEPLAEAASALAQAVQDWRLIGRYPSGDGFLPVASPGGSLIAAASVHSPADVNLFDAGGSHLRTLVGPDHPAVVARVGEFHPVENAIAVAYGPGEGPEGAPDVVVFDASDGTALRQFDLDTGASEVGFSPSGTWLAMSSGREVRVFDWEEGTEVSRLTSPADVGHPYFLNDNQILVPVEGSGFATYSLNDGRLVDEKPVADLSLVTAADADRTRLAFRAGERIRVIDLSGGDIVFDLKAPWVIALALDPDGSRLAYSGFDSNIYVVPVEGEGASLELAGILANVQALSFVDSERLLSHGEDALLWDVSAAGPDLLGAVALSEDQWGFQVSPDMRLLSYFVSAGLGASPTSDPTDGMRLVDLASGDETLVVQREIMSIAAGYRQVSPDFTMAGSLTQEGVSTVRRLPSWEVVRQFDDCRSPLALTPDNSRVLLTGWVCEIEAPDEGPNESQVIEMDSGEPILTIPYRMTWSASFSPEGVFASGRYLVATDQLSMGVWDLMERESIGSFAAAELGDVGRLMILSFDPTGRYVVGGTTAGTVWVLDMERVVGGAEMMDAIVFSRQTHAGAAPVPALSADGVVATAGFDGMVRLWDLHSGDLLLEFEAEMGTPVVRFTPDGTHLLYPDKGAIRRMPVDVHELRELATHLLTRDLLPDECSRYARQERCDALGD